MNKKFKVMAMVLALFALAWFIMDRAVDKIFNLF